MHKVALLKVHHHTHYSNYGDDEIVTSMIDHISDWEEVTTEDLKLLKQYCYSNASYIVVEFMDKSKLRKSISEVLAEQKKAEQDRIKAAELAAERKLQRELKKKAKTEAEQRALFEQLSKQFGQPVVS